MNDLMDITQATELSEHEISELQPSIAPAAAPTEKQLGFMRKLAAERGAVAWIEEMIAGPLDKRGASKLIDELMAMPKVVSSSAVSEPGFYMFGETVYKVRWNQAKTNLYAQALSTVGSKGKWIYAEGAMSKIKADMKLTVDDAAAFGHHNGYCAICGLELSNPESVARGIGPVCINKI